ncbi:HAD domain-containing protein [Pseudomonas aeruginosa]
MFLMLDFDGVLHTCAGGPDNPEFQYLPRLASVLMEYSDVQIVISSSWRSTFKLEELRGFFPVELRARIIGVTPRLKGLRIKEIKAWIKDNAPGAPWLALDDQEAQFSDRRRLILCNDGFHDAEEAELRRRLSN